ncbi:zonular occludens toxin domain-containing protein [Chromobacterium amazonense]|uniref:zonular occludens toxin domain-containing protein n=1 Tax=Chromobacterium amazonense TaxID=1382803 RepID=UPI003F791729
MITLITAVPGSGKTLYTLKTLHELATREDRQVYYHNIPLTEKGKQVLGWIELEDPTKWYELPPLAIIVMDEFQKVFVKRPNGSPVPKHVSEFETHRHKGLDIFLITQGTKLFDPHIKDLIGRHVHLIRVFGAQMAQVLRWDGFQADPNSRRSKDECLDRHKFIYPKEVFSWYKSAEAHTHKFKLPKRIWMMLAMFIAAAAALYFSVHFIGGMSKTNPANTSAGMVPSQFAAPSAGQGGQTSQTKASPLTAAEYAAQRVPRIQGSPESEPRYDAIATPKTFPRVAACLATASRCQCYTQQGTPVDMPVDMCRERVAKSQFDPYIEERREREDLREVSRDPAKQSASGPTYFVMGNKEPRENRFDALRPDAKRKPSTYDDGAATRARLN